MSLIQGPALWWGNKQNKGAMQPPLLPPEPPDMELLPRIAKLEAATEHIGRDVAELKADVRELRRDMRTDFRLLFAALIAVALGLASLMSKGFGWL
jgi:hypothetical protein